MRLRPCPASSVLRPIRWPPNITDAPPDASPVIIFAGLTTADIEGALKAAASANWDAAVQAFKDKGLNIGEDLIVLDDALGIAALLGVPDAALADAIVKLLRLLKAVMDAKGMGFIPPWDPKFNQQWMPSAGPVIHPNRRGQI